MENNKMKNIIVLKNLPSNIVEEAIVVLKENKIKLPENVDKTNEKMEKSKDYILKEAEMIISNYLSKIENRGTIGKKKSNVLEKRYKILQFISIALLLALATAIFF